MSLFAESTSPVSSYASKNIRKLAILTDFNREISYPTDQVQQQGMGIMNQARQTGMGAFNQVRQQGMGALGQVQSFGQQGLQQV